MQVVATPGAAQPDMHVLRAARIYVASVDALRRHPCYTLDYLSAEPCIHRPSRPKEARMAVDDQPPRPRPIRAPRGRARDAIAGYLFIAPFLLAYALFLVMPFLRGIWISLHDWNLLAVAINPDAARFVGARNYVRMLWGEGIVWSLDHQVALRLVGLLAVAAILWALAARRRRPRHGARRARRRPAALRAAPRPAPRRGRPLGRPPLLADRRQHPHLRGAHGAQRRRRWGWRWRSASTATTASAPSCAPPSSSRRSCR